MSLARLYTFTPGTLIVSGQVNSELDQLVNLLNGTSTNVDVLIKMNSGSLAPLSLDQISTGPILVGRENGTERFRFTSKGKLQVPASHTTTPTTNITPGGLYYVDSSTIGNVGFGLDDLHSKSIEANVFSTVNDTMIVYVAGKTAANANNKQINASLGGTQFFTTGVLATLNNKDWQGRFIFTRIDASTIRFVLDFKTSDNGSGVTVWANSYTGTVGGLTFSSAIIFKMTGESPTAGANDDIQQVYTSMFKYPPV